MSQCFPTGESAFNRDLVNEKVIIQIAPTIGNQTYLAKGLNDDSQISEVTYWLGQLLRSLRVPCKVGSSEKKDCSVCDDIRTHIKAKCDDAYIDGLGLRYHSGHVRRTNNYVTKGLEVRTPDNVKLAYYHPGGVDFRLFPYKEGRILITDMLY